MPSYRYFSSFRAPLVGLLLLFSLSTIFGQIPSPVQTRFYERPNTQFMHFSICTFIDCQWDTTLPDPNTFNPTDIDTDQWMTTAALWGASTVCLTVRHVDGFTLWPSKSTPYTIAASKAFQNGTGDIVRDFVNSANKFGIEPCFYIILGFNIYANHTNVSGSQYLQDQVTALTELLTNYGPIARLWWDNYALDASIYQPVTHEGFICENNIPGPSCPGWAVVTETVRNLSSSTIIVPGPDGCLVDAENLSGQYPVYRSGNFGSYICQFSTAPSNGTTMLAVESDFSILNPGDRWFYDNSTVFMNAGDIWSTLTLKRGQGANVIFNIPPDTRGRIPDDIVATLGQYREVYDNTYMYPVASLPSPVSGLCTTDGNGLSVTIPMDPNGVFDQFVLMEDMSINGQIVNGYTLEIQDNTTNEWKTLPVHGITIGAQLIDYGYGHVTNVRTVRFNCTASIPGTPSTTNATIKSIVAYLGAPIPS